MRLNGVQRHVDAQIISDRRLAGSEFGYRSATTTYMNRIEDLVGTPDKQGSLSAQLAEVENSLITASSRPDAIERLSSAALAAGDLAKRLNVQPNTLTAQLNQLTASHLISRQRRGRSIIYKAELPAPNEVVLYLIADCCDGRDEVCAPILDAIQDVRC